MRMLQVSDSANRTRPFATSDRCRRERQSPLEPCRLCKLRTSLSSAGVAIGIAAMAIIVSFATGVQDSLTNAFAITGQLDQVSVGDSNFGLTGSSKHKVLDAAALSQLAALHM